MQSYNSQNKQSPDISCSIRKIFDSKNRNENRNRQKEVKMNFCEISRTEQAEILQTKLKCMNVLVSSAVKAAEDAGISAKKCWDITPPITP